MQDHPVLGQVALGYSPAIDRQRQVMATRLTIFPERPDASPDPQALLRALDAVWPPTASGGEMALQLSPRPFDASVKQQRAAALPAPLVSLNLAGEALLAGVLASSPGPQLMVEVPAFMAADAAHVPALQRLHAAGSRLLIKGRPLAPLPPAVLGLFTHAIVDAADAPAAAAGGAANPPNTVVAGVRSSAAVDAAFQRGASAVLGWPWDDEPPPPSARSSVPNDVKTVMELISGVEREESTAKLEAVLKRDPTLAFRLMRYLNSPAFGLSVEINSFGHALMMLGHQRLKRWLALLLASSAKGVHAKPLLFAAVRRGLLMEELAREQAPADDAETRGEMFICGVFSLLDRLLQQPFSELLASVPVPERVQQALRGEGGPYGAALGLVQAIEQESLFDMRERAEALLLGSAAVNRAVLGALQAARQLE